MKIVHAQKILIGKYYTPIVRRASKADPGSGSIRTTQEWNGSRSAHKLRNVDTNQRPLHDRRLRWCKAQKTINRFYRSAFNLISVKLDIYIPFDISSEYNACNFHYHTFDSFVTMEASAFSSPLLSTLEGCYSFYGGSILFVLSLAFLITILPIPPESKTFPGFKLYGNLPGDRSFAKTKAQYATSGGTWIKNAYQQVSDPQPSMYPINNGAKPGTRHAAKHSRLSLGPDQ